MRSTTSASCCNKVLHISCHFNDHKIRALHKYKVRLLAGYIYQVLTKCDTELLIRWRIPLEPDSLRTQQTLLRGIYRTEGLNSTLVVVVICQRGCDRICKHTVYSFHIKGNIFFLLFYFFFFFLQMRNKN